MKRIIIVAIHHKHRCTQHTVSAMLIIFKVKPCKMNLYKKKWNLEACTLVMFFICALYKCLQ